MIQLDKVVNQDIGFIRMVAMQTARILLQRPCPRDWKRQDQGIQGRMVETFAD